MSADFIPRVLTLLAFGVTLGGPVTTLAAQRPGAPPHGGMDGHALPGRRGPGDPTRALLRGITLTDAQRAQVDAWTAARRAEHDSMRTAMRGARGSGDQAARTRPDSATMAARRAEMDQRRRTQLASLRAILTPDQQARFDGNVAGLEQRMRDRGDRRGRGGPWHGRGA